MNKKEAIQAMLDGKKVKVSGTCSVYFFDGESFFRIFGEEEREFNFNLLCDIYKWEIYEPKEEKAGVIEELEPVYINSHNANIPSKEPPLRQALWDKQNELIRKVNELSEVINESK